MSETIKYLKNDHRIMLTLLKRSKAQHLTTDQKSAYLKTIHSILKDHLKYEDQHLYPKLLEISKSDDSVASTISIFTNGLGKLSQIINNFFDEFEHNPLDIHKSSDFSKIVNLLEVRIKKEELELYPLFDNLVE